MLVKHWMSTNLITVDANASMQDAVKLIKKHHIRGLPVLKNGNLVGIVTDRDLKKASPSDANTNLSMETPLNVSVHNVLPSTSYEYNNPPLVATNKQLPYSSVATSVTPELSVVDHNSVAPTLAPHIMENYNNTNKTQFNFMLKK